MGISLAASQRDIKRLLAYSSIENIGIITTGIGIALIGQTTGNASLAWLGMAGALLHVLNHSFFKPLLFMGAGSVIHATGTREMDRMGGLSKNMRWTAFLSLCGVMAISGLPPFNGFVSEFMLYMGFFGEATSPAPYVALGAPVLALVGGVAVISFVKLYGVTFLGSPRSEQASRPHEAPAFMLIPMALLAGACLLAGLAPQAFLPLAISAMTTLTPVAADQSSPPVQLIWFTIAGLGMLGLAAVVTILLRRRLATLPSAQASTWGCGYLRPSARMQYTGTSFTGMLATLMKTMVRTHVTNTEIRDFAPQTAAHCYLPEETIIERLIMPPFRFAGMCFAFLRQIQNGLLHIYMLYFFVTLVVLMLWTH
jgi:hydrogenase-4 component B